MWHSIPLTLFWFTYFGSLGIFYPYFTLYLRENAGLTGILVRTGKFLPTDLERATGEPDHVLDSIADLPAWLATP